MSNMARCTYIYVLWIVLKLASAFIMPMTNPGGDPDIASIVNHVTLMEQTMHVQNSQIATLATKLEAAEKEVKTTGSDMRTVQAELKTTKAKVNTLENQLSSTNTKLQKSIFHTDFLTTGITSKIATLEQHMSYIHSNLSKRIDMTSTDVAFQVSQMTTKSGWTSLTFATVDHNLGGGYNPTSGYFTAPVSGTYVIWMNILIGHSNGDVFIFKNSNIIASGDGYASGIDYSTGSATTVTHLNIRDTIHFTVDSASCSIYGEKYSQFGGSLIHASSGTL